MGIAIYGVTLFSQNPWTDAQKSAVQRACREVLRALKPEEPPPSEEEVAAYWEAHVESPTSAYWQFYDDHREAGLLYAHFETHCCPLGMKVTSHFSI